MSNACEQCLQFVSRKRKSGGRAWIHSWTQLYGDRGPACKGKAISILRTFSMGRHMNSGKSVAVHGVVPVLAAAHADIHNGLWE